MGNWEGCPAVGLEEFLKAERKRKVCPSQTQWEKREGGMCNGRKEFWCGWKIGKEENDT